MKALGKNLSTLIAYTTMFYFVNKKVLKLDRTKSFGISFIMGFFAGLLNAIYQQSCDINDKIKSNDATKSDIS